MRLLTDLAGCLCEQIREDGLQEPCFCGVMPGERVAFDYVGNCEDQDGMAWTRLITAYPAAGVGRVNQTVNNCNSTLGIEVEIGLLRSAPTMEAEGEPPSEGSQLETTALQIADMLAMARAVQCCFGNKDYDYILSQYRPFGPMGFAVGGTYSLMVAL
jgi:hypothetical protein